MCTCSRDAVIDLVASLAALLVLASPVAATAAPPPLRPGTDGSPRDVCPALEVLEDPGGLLTIAAVTAPPHAARFAAPRGHCLTFPRSASAWWVRFAVAAPRDAEWLLQLCRPYVSSLDLYVRDPASGMWRARHAGFFDADSLTHALLFQLPHAAGRQPVYLRLASDWPIHLQPTICSAAGCRAAAEARLLWTGLVLGVLLVIALLHLVLYRSLHDRSYLRYVAFVSAVALLILLESGLVTRHLAALPPSTLFRLSGLAIGLIVVSAGAFSRAFLETRRTAPLADRLALTYMALGAGLILIQPFAAVRLTHLYALGLGALAPLVVIGSGLLCLRRGFRPARLYVVAWALFSAGAFIIALHATASWGARAFELGAVLNALLLTAALRDRMATLRSERERLDQARLAAEEALRDSEARYRAIFETAGSAMIIYDDDGRVLLGNREFAQLSGYDAAAIAAGLSFLCLFRGRSLERLREDHVHHADDPQATRRSYGTALVDRLGRDHEGLLVVDLIPGTQQHVAAFVDLTQRKQAEQQMLRADKLAALGQIIAGVAHEINNPNNFIYFNLPILKRYVEAMRPLLDHHAAEDPDLRVLNMPYEVFLADVYKLIDNMQHGSERIIGIVSELKDYIRGHDVEERAPGSIAQVVEHVMTLVGKQVQQLVKHLEVELAPGLPPVLMNAGKIEQVLINLLINAAQAADKPDSQVRLIVRRAVDPRWLELRVEDNGAGIAEEIRERIFDPFFTTKGRESGTGLGLAISQRIVEEHGGHLALTSELGAGACFRVLLPFPEPPTG